MRRTDREITDPAQMEDILRRGQVVHLALTDGNLPYVVPLNYGFALERDKRVLYFHGAGAGKKLELIRKNPQAAFCVDLGHGLVRGDSAAQYSYRYESVLGSGIITEVRDLEEKRRGLMVIFAQYEKTLPFQAEEKLVEHTAVLRLEIQTLTGKRRTQKERNP